MHLKYGLDAPLVLILFILGGLISIISLYLTHSSPWSYSYGMFMIIAGAIHIHTSVRGKFKIWQTLIW